MRDSDDNHYSYSIAIRTLGKASIKYQKLLDSIQRLRIIPEQIIVVLPNGYDLPEERLGIERFVFCEKSMVQQRIEAIKYIESDYTLFLDDDIEFEPNFVEKLISALKSGTYDCATGPLFSFFPQSLVGKIAGTIIGNVSFRIRNKGYYVRILRNGGWSYRYINTNRSQCYPTESFAWTCFMIRTDVMRDIKMEDEKDWLEINGYAWGDDRVMAYKLCQQGYRACVVSDALYIHNDAKTSTKGHIDSTRKVYCSTFFSKVFWQKFIQDTEKNICNRLLNRFCFNYTFVMEVFYYLIKTLTSLGNGGYKMFKAFINGEADANNYIRDNL